jgi:glycerol-3-phosphate acyltransferase PlsY
MFNIYLILFFILAYVLGSFPTAYFIVKKSVNKDVRKQESKNVGAMNVMRITGKPLLFLLTVFVDTGKGALSVLIPQKFTYLNYNLVWAISLAGFGVVLGHCFSLYFKIKDNKFSGGKAQACLAGVLMTLNFKWLFLPWALSCLLFVLATQTFFFGQFMGNIFLPLIGYFLVPEYFLLCVLTAIPIFIKQWPHFIPVLKGARPKWYFRGKNK